MKQVYQEKPTNFLVKCGRCEAKYIPRVNAVPRECKECGSVKMEKFEKQRDVFSRSIGRTLQLLESFLNNVVEPQLCDSCRNQVTFNSTDFRERNAEDDNQ